MITFIQLLILCLFGVFATNAVTDYSEDTLEDSHGKVIHSSVIFRHGDRSPTKPYPTDPYDESYWPQGWGQLSKVGKLQEYELGQWFRSRYNSLIKQGYRYDLLRANSSDMDRTIMSGQLFLAGFLPPEENELWINTLEWQPIPLHSIPAELDDVIGLKKPCERYELEKLLVNTSPEMEAYYWKNKEIFDYVAEHSGYEFSAKDVMKSIDNIWDVYDTLFVEDTNNLTLPLWTKKVYPEPLRSIGQPSFSNIAYSYEMRRLRGGPLIKSIIQDMRQKVNGELNETFHFYSGHDTTISVLLTSLNMYNSIPPPYGASVIVELRKKDGDFVVTILYKNSTVVAPTLLLIPGCNFVCTLDDFISTTAHLIPQNWEEECSIGFINGLSYSSIFELIVLMAVVFLFLVLVLTVIRLHILRKRRYSHYEIIRNNVLNVKDGLD